MSDPTGVSSDNGAQFAQPQQAYQPQQSYTTPFDQFSQPAQQTGEVSAPVQPVTEPHRDSRGKSERFFSGSALVLVIAVAALFVTAIVLILFNSSSDSVNALAVVAVAIVSLTAAYFGVRLAVTQLREERTEKAAALERVAAAEISARESDAWSAQMEAGLRVAMVKLQAAGIPSDDVVKAAGAPDDFF